MSVIIDNPKIAKYMILTMKNESQIYQYKKPNAQQQFAEMAGLVLNLKLVLYLQSQCLTESLGFLNPPLLQAAKR